MGNRLTQIATRTGDDGTTGLGDNTRVSKDSLRVHFELLKPQAVLDLDQALQEHNAVLPKLQEFILPAGTRAAALAHVCRTVARRSERAVVALGAQDALKDTPRQYLNRLSDLMFVLARVLNRHRTDGSTGDDVYWRSERLAKAVAE